MLIIDFQDKECTSWSLWVLGDSSLGRGRGIKGYWSGLMAGAHLLFIFGAESLPGQMSVRKDQPLFPAAVHNHCLCFKESELKYKCQAISSLYQKGWEKWGVKRYFHMVTVCSRAAQLRFKGVGWMKMSRKWPGAMEEWAPSTSQCIPPLNMAGLAMLPTPLSVELPLLQGKGAGSLLLCLAAPQVTGSSSSCGSIWIHGLFFLRWPNSCLSIFHMYMEKRGFFYYCTHFFGICIVTIIINASVLSLATEVCFL